jgi:hypothetical protein
MRYRGKLGALAFTVKRARVDVMELVVAMSRPRFEPIAVSRG